MKEVSGFLRGSRGESSAMKKPRNDSWMISFWEFCSSLQVSSPSAQLLPIDHEWLDIDCAEEMLWGALVSSVIVSLQWSPIKPQRLQGAERSCFDGGHFVVGQGRAGRWEDGLRRKRNQFCMKASVRKRRFFVKRAVISVNQNSMELSSESIEIQKENRTNHILHILYYIATSSLHTMRGGGSQLRSIRPADNHRSPFCRPSWAARLMADHTGHTPT